MSKVVIEDPAWRAIMADPELASARSKLSFHEIRLIVDHARNAGCPVCMGRSSYEGDPALSFCDEHYRDYLLTFQISPSDLDAYRAKVKAQAPE